MKVESAMFRHAAIQRFLAAEQFFRSGYHLDVFSSRRLQCGMRAQGSHSQNHPHECSRENIPDTTMRRFFRVVAVAMVFWMGGCSTADRGIEVGKLGPAQEILIYQNGRPVVKRALARGSVEAESVASWLRSHQDGWRTDMTDYVPVRQVKGTDFTLNFHPALCILNYQRGEGDWKQVSRPIAPDDPVPDVFGESR
jgi:hypothetical protein